MKQASRKLDELPQAGRDFALVQVWIEQVVVKRLPEVYADDLKVAWLGLVARARVNRHHRVTREQLSVREHMTRILRRLHDSRLREFADLFSREAGVLRARRHVSRRARTRAGEPDRSPAAGSVLPHLREAQKWTRRCMTWQR